MQTAVLPEVHGFFVGHLTLSAVAGAGDAVDAARTGLDVQKRHASCTTIRQRGVCSPPDGAGFLHGVRLLPEKALLLASHVS